MKARTLSSALTMLMILSLAHPVSGAGDEPHDDHHDDSLVKLTPREMEEFGIELDTAGERLIESYLSLPGEIQPNDDRLAHIVPRYSGIVMEVRAQIVERFRQ